jgi:dihydropyrimidine dehydrogenase (NAD+) subunit PreT
MTTLLPLLPSDRLEQKLRDKKPLYTEAEARAEADRCLYCADAPCIKACPTSIDIPTFIKKIASDNVKGSARTILEQNLLGYSCARVCPVEVLCVGDCVYNGWEKEPIAIGRLQRFATETALKADPALLKPKPRTSTRKVALIGAGPASLACAGTLALEGIEAVIFEKLPLGGGLNTTGIAPYKLHSEDALAEVEWIKSLGVTIHTGKSLGEDIKGADLLRDYDAVFLGFGLGVDTRLGIPGEDGTNVVGATEWIADMKLRFNGETMLGRVVVVGGGNTAIDVARECAQLGAREVIMVYRRSRKDMSGYEHEMAGAAVEGVRLIENAQPVEVVREGGSLRALKLCETKFGKPIAGTDFEVPCDIIALAIGQSKLGALASEFAGVSLNDKGCVVVDPVTMRTGNPKVFAGGDCINGGKEVVNSVAHGRDAAREILKAFGHG